MLILPPRTFPPPGRIERRHTPAPTSGRHGYRSYRACLRWEFGFTCAFCLLHESDLTEHGIEGTGLTGIEHFSPVSAAQERTNDYGNCFYACRFCNGARSSSPTADPAGRKLLNPCDEAWGTHFAYDEDRLLPRERDVDAAYTEEIYDFNDPRRVAIRRWRRERLEEHLRVLREGPPLIRALLDACAEVEPARGEQLLRGAQAIRDDVQRALRDLQRFAAIPQDADLTCRCGREGHHALPQYLVDQTFEISGL